MRPCAWIPRVSWLCLGRGRFYQLSKSPRCAAMLNHLHKPTMSKAEKTHAHSCTSFINVAFSSYCQMASAYIHACQDAKQVVGMFGRKPGLNGSKRCAHLLPAMTLLCWRGFSLCWTVSRPGKLPHLRQLRLCSNLQLPMIALPALQHQHPLLRQAASIMHQIIVSTI